MPATPEPSAAKTIIALDYGSRRIGVAVGQQVTGTANPLATLDNGASGPDWEALGTILDEWRPSRLVVGMPYDADGNPTETSAAVEAFMAALDRFDLPVDTIDERYSSLEAEEMLRNERAMGIRGRIRKDMIDAAAATLIAERWLQRNCRPQTDPPPSRGS